MSRNPIKCERVILLCIFGIGLVLRLALVGYATQYPDRYIQADAVGYDRLGTNLASGIGFSMDLQAPYTPDNFRTPGYPLTIASVYALFGHRPDIVLWLQALMGALTILLAYALAAKVFDSKAGLLAAFLLAVSPHSITYTALLWSDTEYTLLFSLAILLSVSMLITNDYKLALLSGLVSGAAVLVHPRSLYLPVMLALCLAAVMLARRNTFTQALIHAGSFLLVFNLVLLPWRARNYAVFGVPNISSAAGINMLNYGAALTEAAHTGESQWSIAARYGAEIIEKSAHPLNSAEFGELAFRHGLDKVLDDPLTYARVHVIGMAKIFLPGTSQVNTLLTGRNTLDTGSIYALFSASQNTQSGQIRQSLSNLSILAWLYIGFEMFYLLGIYLFSFYALVTRTRSQPWVWIIIITILYLAAVVGPAGTPRFRVAMMPLLCVIAAGGMASVRSITQKLDRLCG